MGHNNPNSLANLKPAKPGEVRNPKGLNQFTYRQDAETTFARLLDRVDPSSRDGQTISQTILENLVMMARGRDRWAIDRVLERILPKVDKVEATVTHEVEFTSPEQYEDPNEWSEQAKSDASARSEDPKLN